MFVWAKFELHYGLLLKGAGSEDNKKETQVSIRISISSISSDHSENWVWKYWDYWLKHKTGRG